MARRATVEVDILVNNRDAARNMDQTAGQFGRMGDTIQGLAAPAAVAIGALGAVGLAAGKSASAVEQSMGALESVFGASADQVKAWSENSAEAVGLSQSSYAQLASVTGASLKSMGLSQDEAATSTGELITLAADLAATMGGTTEQAVQALTSALRGEADPAEALGLKLNQTTVQAYLASKGQQDLTGAALEAAKAQAIMELATQQAGGAIGAFARESDTAAGSQQIAAAAYEDAKAALGQSLLPVMVAAADAMKVMADWATENSDLLTKLALVVGALAATVLLVNGAMMAYAAIQAVIKGATAAWTAAQWLLNAALTANPIGLVVLAIAALVAGFVLLWNKSEGFRNFFIDMWNTIQRVVTDVWRNIQSAIQSAIDFIMRPISAMKDAISGVIEKIKSAIDWAKNLVKNIPVIGGLFGRSVGPQGVPGFMLHPAPGVTGVSLRGPSALGVSTGRGGPGVVNITVTGALDPVAVARQIQALLGQQARRQTGVRI
jgi:hypothetical protein